MSGTAINDIASLYQAYAQWEMALGKPFMPLETFRLLRVPETPRADHLAIHPGHDWVHCKSWHCFHGNPENMSRPQGASRLLSWATGRAASA
jgi:hypothetical protein